MRRFSKATLLCSATILMMSAAASGQAKDDNKPDAPQSPTNTITTTTPTAPAAAPAASATFPAVIKKNLFAKNDYRGKKAPDFHVESWLGKDAKAPDRKDKVVLIDIWATWCPPCRAAIPELNEWHKRFKDDLVIIGVSDEPAATVETFMGLRAPAATPAPNSFPPKRATVEYPMAIDTKAQMKSALAVAGIPHVLIIDSTGIVRWQGFPQNVEERLTADVLKQIIEADKAQRKAAKPDETPTKPALALPQADAPATKK